MDKDKQRRSNWYQRNKWVDNHHMKKHGMTEREYVIFKYGGKCTCCGEDYYPFLEIDHVNNDGNVHRLTLKTLGLSILQFAIRNSFPPMLQILCANCNRAKAKNKKGICECQTRFSILDIAKIA